MYGKVILGSADITMDVQRSSGIYAHGSSADTSVTIDNLTKITMSGASSWGVRVQNTNGKVNLKDLDLTIIGVGSKGIFANMGSSIAVQQGVMSGTGNSIQLVNAQGVGTNVSLGNVQLDVTGISTRGFYAQYGGAIVAGLADITTAGAGSAALAVSDASSSVTVNGGLISSSDVSSAVMRIYNITDAGVNNPVINITNVQAEGFAGSRLINSTGFGTVNAVRSMMTGDVYEQDNLLVLNMDASELTGGISGNTAGHTDLTLENDSRWNVNKNSAANILDNRSSTIDMSSHSSGYETLTINDLRGSSGNLIMDTDLASETAGDKVNITSAAAGATYVQVKDLSLTSGTEVTGVKNLLLITDASANATFVGKNLNVGGLWDVTPTIANGLAAFDASGNQVGTASQWFLTKLAKSVNNDTKVLLEAADSGYGLWRNTNDTLRSRLGELHYRGNQTDSDGIWARYNGGKFAGNGYDGHYNMYQLGYDKVADGKSVYGFAFEKGSGSNSYSAGSGKDELVTGSLYGSWYGDDDSYTDVIARVGQFDTDISSYGSFPDKASSKSHAYSVSVEYGKTIELNKAGAFIEPQAQFIVGRLGSSSYTTDRGNSVYLSGVNSYIGRLGFVLGQKNTGNDIYLKANLLHEFGGDRDISMLAANGERLSDSSDYGDTWFELGLGGNVRLGRNSHFYGDIERSFGADIQKKWQVNAGVRFEF